MKQTGERMLRTDFGFVGKPDMVTVSLLIGEREQARQFESIEQASAWVRGLLEDGADILECPSATCEKFRFLQWFSPRGGFEDGTDEFIPDELLWPSACWPNADYDVDEILYAERKRQIAKWKVTIGK